MPFGSFLYELLNVCVCTINLGGATSQYSKFRRGNRPVCPGSLPLNRFYFPADTLSVIKLGVSYKSILLGAPAANWSNASCLNGIVTNINS